MHTYAGELSVTQNIGHALNAVFRYGDEHWHASDPFEDTIWPAYTAEACRMYWDAWELLLDTFYVVNDIPNCACNDIHTCGYTMHAALPTHEPF